jgi:choloylglycine hydrolase
MKIRFHNLSFMLAAACAMLSVLPAASACTGIRLKTADGSVVCARTLEFAADLHSNVIIVPRGKEFVGAAPGGKPGLHWRTKYAAVGANGFNIPAIIDGLNEKGLGVGAFYLPGYAKYQKIEAGDFSKAIAPWEVPAFLLGNCANVEEAIAAAKEFKVGEVVQSDMGIAPPAHYIVHDAAGECVVLEYVNGELKIHDNPLGVITNSPTFDWHITNLSNYINLSVSSVPPVDLKGLDLTAFGQGSGLHGLPGDFTPPSRFVRAAIFSQSALPVDTAREGVLQAFHLLNQFDIPKGSARGQEDGKQMVDYTLWTSASDLANRCYYFHTFDNRRIRMIDLKKMDLDAKEIKTISMGEKEVIEDLSNEAN